MNNNEMQGFYWGAAIFLDLESDEVDAALASVGLSVEHNTAIECREAILQLFPDRHERGRIAGRRLLAEEAAGEN